MLGWINDCLEKLVIEKFGLEAWHTVKQRASCEVEDGGFFKLDHYSDKSTQDLVRAGSEALGVSVDELLEKFGAFFAHYIRKEGYDNLLCCQGSTLKDWMANINAIHQHLQNTFPKKMLMPQFWCEDEMNEDGSLVLYYHSKRGNYFAPLAKGLVSEVASFQFKVDIDMQRIQTQGVSGAKFTSWKVTAIDPKDQWKLTQKEGERDGVKNQPTSFKCPFTGMTARVPSTNSLTLMADGSQRTSLGLMADCSGHRSLRSTGRRSSLAGGHSREQEPTFDPENDEESHSEGCLCCNCCHDSSSDFCGSSFGDVLLGCPISQHSANPSKPSSPPSHCSDPMLGCELSYQSTAYDVGEANQSQGMVLLPPKKSRKEKKNRRTSCNTTASSSSTQDSLNTCFAGNIGLSANIIKSLHPYHIIIDQDFSIVQVGNSLPQALGVAEEMDLVHTPIDQVLEVTKPIGMSWNWKWLQLMEEQSFDLEPVAVEDSASKSSETTTIKFTTTVVYISDSPAMAMLLLNPAANNLVELREMQLTLSDLPVHGAHRDAVFLREHLSTQMNNALKMEKLSRSLEKEKDLLHSLLPRHAAEGLRLGKSVAPMLHSQVTFFFSDVVGFTKICDQIRPWEVIAMLNRLYCVMDHLAKRFQVYKVETIGDAYVCCCGLPEKNADHAQNVSNFALAVQHFSNLILSPVDGSPIQLRIGIHSGACASGVVGMTNPRYCVFGDTVNTTARHESSGLPGRVHLSSKTERALRRQGGFGVRERGLVEMKGKGEMSTFWLESSEFLEEAMLAELELELKELLEKAEFEHGVGGRLLKREGAFHSSRGSLPDISFMDHSALGEESSRRRVEDQARSQPRKEEGIKAVQSQEEVGAAVDNDKDAYTTLQVKLDVSSRESLPDLSSMDHFMLGEDSWRRRAKPQEEVSLKTSRATSDNKDLPDLSLMDHSALGEESSRRTEEEGVKASQPQEEVGTSVDTMNKEDAHTRLQAKLVALQAQLGNAEKRMAELNKKYQARADATEG